MSAHRRTSSPSPRRTRRWGGRLRTTAKQPPRHKAGRSHDAAHGHVARHAAV